MLRISSDLKKRLMKSSDPLIKKLLSGKMKIPDKNQFNYLDFNEKFPKQVIYTPQKKLSLLEEKVLGVGSSVRDLLVEGTTNELDIGKFDLDFPDEDLKIDGSTIIEPGSGVYDQDVPGDAERIFVRWKVDETRDQAHGREIPGLKGLYIRQSVSREDIELEGVTFNNKYTQTCKVGKLIKGLFPTESDKSIEEAVNSWTTMTSPNTFVMVSGKDIIDWYGKKHWHPDEKKMGNLIGNCVSDKPRGQMGFFAEASPESVNVLTYRDQGYLVARALVWNTTHPKTGEPIHLMDRVHGTDASRTAFAKFARDNKMWYKYKHHKDHIAEWMTPDNNYKTKVTQTFVISLPNLDRAYGYPWMDTFRFGYSGIEMISNIDDGNYNLDLRKEGKVVSNEEYVLIDRHKLAKASDMKYVASLGEYLHKSKVVEVRSGDFLPKAEAVKLYDNTYVSKQEEVVYLSDTRKRALANDPAIFSYLGKNYMQDKAVMSEYEKCLIPESLSVKYEGNWFTKDSLKAYKLAVKKKEIPALPNPFLELPKYWYVQNPTPSRVEDPTWAKVVAYARVSGLEDLEGNSNYLGVSDKKSNNGWTAISSDKAFTKVSKSTKWEKLELSFMMEHIETVGVDISQELKEVEEINDINFSDLPF